MRERWFLFYDGACPLCIKTQSKLNLLISNDIKITAVNLNSSISLSKGYNNKNVVLETPSGVYFSYHAWLKILSKTKYKWSTSYILRPFLVLFYWVVSKNRKLINKIIKK